MGTIQHHALIVTGYEGDVDVAHAKAVELYGATFKETRQYLHTAEQAKDLVGPIIDGLTNGYRTFVLHPDGSKEGWEPSDEINSARSAFIDWLREAHRSGLYFDWVFVGFGELGLQAERPGQTVSAR